MRVQLVSSVLFAVAALAGCATDGGSAGAGASGGGKADDGGGAGLHVEARVTKLGPQNEIRWPVAVDTGSEVDNVINAALDFDKVTGESLEDTKRAWAAAPDDIHQGVDDADFTVDGNLRNVLSVTIQYETIYAYPDQQVAYMNFNSNTGAAVAITDLLDASALPKIAATLDVELQKRIAQLKVDYAADITSGDVDAHTWDDLHVTGDNLSAFSVTPDGITFHYDAGFPHVIVGLEPDGDFKVPFADLDAYTRADGLWAGEN